MPLGNSALTDFRRKNWAQFSGAGFPTTRDENWRYTDLKDLARLSLAYPECPDTRLFHDFASQFSRPGMINLICINGFFCHNQVSEQIRASDLEAVFLDNAQGDILAKLLRADAEAQHANNIFSSFSNAFFPDGLLLRVLPNAVLGKTINLIYLTCANTPIVICPRVMIDVGKSAQATLIESYASPDDRRPYFVAPYTTIHLAPNASLHYAKIQNESKAAYHINNTFATLTEGSTLESFFLTIAAAVTRNNLGVVMKESGGSAAVHGLALLKEKNLADNHTFIEHVAPDTSCVQHYKSIVFDSARNVFHGRILVRPEAQRTNSYQINKNLLMGNDSRVDTKPQLEIFADDVKCSHGATIGQLTKEEIFYLRSRGLDPDTTIAMLAHGFAEEVISLIKEPIVAAEVRQTLSTSWPHGKG